MANVLGFSGFGVAVFALISVIASVALDYWKYTSKSDDGITQKTYSGLWNSCDEKDTRKHCTSYGEVSSELATVRAMVLLALFLDVGAIVCGALKLFMMKDKRILGYVTTGLLLVAGLFLIVGFGVYVDKIYNPDKDRYKNSDYKPSLHAGFAFCVIAWIASWVSAALFGVVTVKEKDGE